MKIKKAGIDDLSVILKLQKFCYNENAVRYNNFKIPPLIQTLKEFEKKYSDGIVLKAIEQAKIVGSIRAFEEGGTCFIGRVIVHPDFQNKGIGKKLMIDIELMFPNANRFELFTGLRDDKNLYFYKKLAYKQFNQVNINDDLTLVYLEKANLKKNNLQS